MFNRGMLLSEMPKGHLETRVLILEEFIQYIFNEIRSGFGSRVLEKNVQTRLIKVNQRLKDELQADLEEACK